VSDTSSESWIGKTVGGRYLIEKKLGAGAMGAVFIANQISMDRKVALKLLHANLQGSESLVRRFEREMKATSKVDHQNTVRVYDFGETDEGKLFLAMELVKGGSLKDAIVETGTFDTARALKIAIQIGKALNAAHSENIVHRDLKPDNVMLMDRYGEQDFVKVLDFGIARFVDETATQLTNDGQVMGTPLYIAPEQAQGQTVDHRADLYALGVILYQLVVGKVPFKSETLMGLLLMHAQEPPPPPSEVVPGLVPQPVERLILHLMEKNPDDRPQSAAETVSLLEQCLRQVGPGSAHMGVQPARTIANPGKELKGGGSTVGLQAQPVPKSMATMVDGGGKPSGGSKKGLIAAIAAVVVIGGTVAGLAAAGVFGGGDSGSTTTAEKTEKVDKTDKDTPEKKGDDNAEKKVDDDKPDKKAGDKGDKKGDAKPDAKEDEPDKPAGDAKKAGDDKAVKPQPKPDDGATKTAAGDAKPAPDAGATAAAKPDAGAAKPQVDKAMVDALRKQLSDAQKRMDDPPAPFRCQTRDPDVLSVLVRVAGFLQKAALDSNTTLDKLALQQLASVAKKGETSPEYWSFMALAQLATEGDEAKMAGPLSAAKTAAMCTEWAVGHRLLGNAAYRTGDLPRAIESYKRALALLPTYPKVATNLALAELKAKKYADAVETAGKVLAKSPADVAALDVRYQANFNLKKFAEAETDLVALVAKLPDNKALWFNLGAARAMQKKAEATEAFCKAKKLGHPGAAQHCPQ